MRRPRSIPVKAIITAALFVLVCGGTAVASWSAVADGSGTSRATSIPDGAQPATVETFGDVQVSWAATEFPDGTPVDGYSVTAYDGGLLPRAPAGTCAGVVTTTSCTDAAIPDGEWTYTVTPQHLAWVGGEGPQSSPPIFFLP